MKGNVCIDTIRLSIQLPRKKSLIQYFIGNGYIIGQDIFNASKVLSTSKKQLDVSKNISICRIRESKHKYGFTTTIEFYGLANYHTKDIKEKYDGYRLFIEYCRAENLLDELKIREIHIDIDMNIKAKELIDIQYKQKSGPKKEVNQFTNMNFKKGTFYLKKIDYFKVLYRLNNKTLIDVNEFRILYNDFFQELNNDIDPNDSIGYKLEKIPYKDELLNQFNKYAKRFDEYDEIKDIFEKFKYVNPDERINKIFDSLEKLEYKNKNIRMQEASKIIMENENFNVYYDDDYIYIKRDDYNRFFMLDELKERLEDYHTTISHKTTDSNEVIVYDKAYKENLDIDLMRFEFIFIDPKKDKKIITFSQSDEISNIFKNEVNHINIKYLDNSQERLVKYNSKLETLFKKELDKYFKVTN